MSITTGSLAIFRRELGAYFATPLAWVCLLFFLLAAGILTFYLGGFYERGRADLLPFFNFHPWLYLFLVPAVGMRLWAEERRSGTLELLLSLPVSTVAATSGKFMAAWVFIGLALLLSTPIWWTVNFLGSPDNGVILASYLGSWLMAGAFLAISGCMSALTRSQVIAFVLAVAACFVFILCGLPMVLSGLGSWLPDWLVDFIASLSMLTHFRDISRGMLSLKDVLYFVIMMKLWVLATVWALKRHY